MWNTVPLFLLLLDFHLTICDMRIVKSSPSDSTMVREGESVALSCESNLPWFLCVWTSPQGGKQCAIQEGEDTTSVCQGDSRVLLEGGPTSCSVRILEVQREDRGKWMCLHQDGENFQTDRKLLGLEVATKGKLEMVVKGRETLDGVVRMTEGEEVGVECKVKNAFPKPEFSWSGPGVGNLTVLEDGRHLYDEQESVYLSHSSVTYRASLNDTNSTLVCMTEQRDRKGLLLYSLWSTVTVDVEPLPLPQPYSVSVRVGVVTGVVLTVLFLLLVCVAVTAVMCKRQRREEGSQQSESCDYQTESLQPIWTSPRWPSLPNSMKKREEASGLVSGAPSYSVVNLSSEAGVGLHSTPTSNLSSSASILTDSSPPRGTFSLQPAPSLHETHFSDLLDQPPVTHIHPPGLYLHMPQRSASLLPGQGLLTSRKVSSSQSEGFPCCPPSSFGSRYSGWAPNVNPTSGHYDRTTMIFVFFSDQSLQWV